MGTYKGPLPPVESGGAGELHRVNEGATGRGAGVGKTVTSEDTASDYSSGSNNSEIISFPPFYRMLHSSALQFTHSALLIFQLWGKLIAG